jgi:ubiquinone/menaquinone biosynthesis C-methylase UbiE
MMEEGQRNLDSDVVRDFGSEWTRFDQSRLSHKDLVEIFDDYFRVFPWDCLPAHAVGADIGCGSGRWAMLVAPRVAHLHLVDASSDALAVARRNLQSQLQTSFHLASVDSLPFAEDSLDFAYSLGVLHHVPDTGNAIKSIARALKPGAPFLVYLYYAFDQRSILFRLLWKCSDLLRRLISNLPSGAKNLCCEIIAYVVYLPLARCALLMDRFGVLPDWWPLSYYRSRALYVLRTDALDRFGTRLERRFTQREIEEMLRSAGFEGTRFSDRQPFWCAVAYKRQTSERAQQ